MRFRVKRGGPAAGFTFDRTAKPVQRPEPEKPVSLAQALSYTWFLLFLLENHMK